MTSDEKTDDNQRKVLDVKRVWLHVDLVCQACNETGQVDEQTCIQCDGKGFTAERLALSAVMDVFRANVFERIDAILAAVQQRIDKRDV